MLMADSRKNPALRPAWSGNASNNKHGEVLVGVVEEEEEVVGLVHEGASAEGTVPWPLRLAVDGSPSRSLRPGRG